jgi:hypothetical protein
MTIHFAAPRESAVARYSIDSLSSCEYGKGSLNHRLQEFH